MSDCGSNFNEGTAFFALAFIKNCYVVAAWKLRPYLIRTDTPSNTYCRAPGTTQGIAIMENMMEHLAKVRKEDPLIFRLRNIDPSTDGDILRQIIEQTCLSGDYKRRLIEVRFCPVLFLAKFDSTMSSLRFKTSMERIAGRNEVLSWCHRKLRLVFQLII